MTQPGIGAAGILGVAVEQLSPPVQSATVPSASGGTLATGTYRYYITAINANGETTISNEQTAAVTGPTGSVTLAWLTVSGATGYRIYRTAAGGAAGTQLLLTSVGAVLTTVDDGSLTPSGAYPTTNTAVTPGTYYAPTKYIPFLSESISITNETVFRRPIRQSADVIGAVAGNYHPEGELNIEALEDCLLYFLWASRTLIVKSGSAPNFTYTVTPTAAAIPNKTLSITIVRNGIVHGYTGMVAANFGFGIDNGLLTFRSSLMGRDEAVQTAPVPTWPSTVPFGAGMYSIEIPTGTPVTDTDTFEWMVEDNAVVNFRLKSSGRGADFINYGERTSTINFERDFLSRTDYDAFKAVTSNSITITATKGVNNSISLLAPVSFKETYEVGLGGQGDLVRAAVTHQNAIDGTGKSWQITVKTQEDILP